MKPNRQPTPEVSIRPAVESDFDFLFNLVRITMEEYVASTTGWDETKEKELFRRLFDLSTYQISVIVLDGHDIGYLKVERTNDEIFLANVHVHPDHQNQGIGSRIIESVLDDARQQGVPISLKVLKVNQPATRLYHRLGFSIQEEADDYYLMRALPR